MSEKKVLIIAAAIVGAVALASMFAIKSAKAQVMCGEHKVIVENLSKTYSEAPVSMGLASNGAIIEVFASPSGSTFTILLTRPDGLTCVMAAGESWEDLPKALRGTKL